MSTGIIEPKPAWTTGTPAAPMHLWGKDHWSTLAYIETRIVDREHMRANPDLHPFFVNRAARSTDRKYPTRLNDGSELHPHDDWSCLDDCEAVGLVENIGTGVNRAYRLTEEGERCTAALRKHKADGKRFHDFRWG